MGAWQQRRRLRPLTDLLQPLTRAATAGFGFEWLNGRIVDGAQAMAAALQETQTGQLSWNIAGIVLALAAVLILLAIGG